MLRQPPPPPKPRAYFEFDLFQPALAAQQKIPLTDIILYQSQYKLRLDKKNNLLPPLSPGYEIKANNMIIKIVSITDILINSPAVDIPKDAMYDNGQSVYVYNSDRKDYIPNTVNTNRKDVLFRTALTGIMISDLELSNASTEDKNLRLTFNAHRNTPSIYASEYFNRAVSYIEPISSASFAISSFIDTVRRYGAAALKLGLVTFESKSDSHDKHETFPAWDWDLRVLNTPQRIKRTLPYIDLINPHEFNEINKKLTIKSDSGGLLAPIDTYSYPDGGTNINAGLENAKKMLDKEKSPGAEKIIILFTDGEPTEHNFSELGEMVKKLTDEKITVYSIVLTISVTDSSVKEFKKQLEVVGKAEPVIFINDPAKLKQAFLQIADELGLKLVR